MSVEPGFDSSLLSAVHGFHLLSGNNSVTKKREVTPPQEIQLYNTLTVHLPDSSNKTNNDEIMSHLVMSPQSTKSSTLSTITSVDNSELISTSTTDNKLLQPSEKSDLYNRILDDNSIFQNKTFSEYDSQWPT